MKKIDHISTTTRLLLLIVMLCLTAIQASAQQKVITGTVSEMLGKSKEPILGANVVLVNAQNRYIKGAVTDMDGNFTLQVPANAGKLKIRASYIGMKTQTVNYNGQTQQNFVLESDDSAWTAWVCRSSNKPRHCRRCTWPKSWNRAP